MKEKTAKVLGKVYEALPEGKIKGKLEQKLLQELRDSMKDWSPYHPKKGREKAKQDMSEAIDRIFDEAPDDCVTVFLRKIQGSHFCPGREKREEGK